MKLALVYDLRDDYRALGYSEDATAEFDSKETIDGLSRTLAQLGWRVELVGRGQELARRFAEGERFDLVFSIAEGLKGRCREAQVPALCEMYDQAYVFSDPLTMAATLDKAVAKRLVRDAGAPTAPFAVIEDADAPLPDVALPAFVKPIAEGTGKGCGARSRVATLDALRDEARRIISLYDQPALAESYLPGREFTVGVIGEGADASVIGVLELLIAPNAEAGVYGFANKQSLGDHFDCRLADDAEARRAGECALAAYRALGCRDAARIDLRSDASGAPMFLEANPIPGLKAGFSDLAILAEHAGLSYDDLIGAIVEKACARLDLATPARREAA